MENIKYIQKKLKLLHDDFDVVQYILKMYWLFKIVFYKLFHKYTLNRKKKNEKYQFETNMSCF